MKKVTVIILMVVFLAMFGCAEKVDLEADKEAIIRASEQIINALRTDDIDGIMSVTVSGHITMAPNQPALSDIATLRSWHEDRVKILKHTGLTTIRDEIEVSGDWAFERWRFTPTVSPLSGGESIKDELKGIWIWKRQTDGTWKIARSIWNSDFPMPDSK